MPKKTLLALGLSMAIIVASAAFIHWGQVQAQDALTTAPTQVLRHNVLFKFKEETAAADIRKVEQAFCALPTKVPEIYDFEWGTDVSVENLADGFTHCFFVTFLNEADRAVYLPHPEHKAFGKILGPHLDKVIVLDYWTKP